MTLEDLYTELAAIAPTAYAAFKVAQEPPFICYRVTDDADVLADDTNYVAGSTFDVELYTDSKDLALEAEVEAALASLEIVWTRTESWIASERMLEVVWTFDALTTVPQEST